MHRIRGGWYYAAVQCKRQAASQRRGFCLLAVLVLTAGVLSLNRYVNTVVKPTLHELAEYEARSAAVQAMNRAVAAELTRSPVLCDGAFYAGSGLVSLTPQPPGRETQFVSAVQTEIGRLCRRSAMPSRSAV